MIRKENNYFILDTEHTTYCFRVMESGHLEHLYYGRKISLPKAVGMEVLMEKNAFPPGTSNIYDDSNKHISLDDVRLEISSNGRGDTREPFIEVVNTDGSFTLDFTYEMSQIMQGKTESEILPGSYGEMDEVEELKITLKDKQNHLALELFYDVYSACDVITRRARLINAGEKEIKVDRLMSMQLDFDTSDYVFTTFNGAWAREMKRNDMAMIAGKHVNASYTGNSSNKANPFVMLSRANTTEELGESYGFNLVYSGNHYEAAEVSSNGKLRLVAGINPQSFHFILGKEESLESPEAVMTYSHKGFNGMSGQMHAFVRNHIVRGEWKWKERPVLLNSWEACYFNINERKLVNLAKAGKDVGVELFVMDDGWFGERNDDTKALGDWNVNKKKLPNGLVGLAKKIRELDMDFGIWVEPEMVNVNSRLYEEHPDWAIQIPGKTHSEGRNQRILDLSRKEVQDFLINKMSEVFASADISYVKWDMNRNFSDYYSQALPAEKQGEMAHRYILGLYRCMKELTKRFPHILFEGCASGGNRFDLGILCYFPQIWSSDDTDALCRAEIQNGYSYGYPLSAMGAHVSACPNHQTLRNTPLETRFNVAAFGVLGYECNLAEMKKEELEEMKAQIALYKEWRQVFQFGKFYRGRSFGRGTFDGAGNGGFGSGNIGISSLHGNHGNIMEWTCVSEDGMRAVGMVMQMLTVPNERFLYYKPQGLLEDQVYHFYNRKQKYNIKNFGSLVNMISPVHIKQDSLVHNVAAKFVKLDGEVEDMTACGDTLMYGGIRLAQAFAGTGYNDQVRYFPDFGSRIYFMEAK